MYEDSQRWPVQKAWDWYRSHPWLCGVNYIPSYAVNFTEMWQGEAFNLQTIRDELELASSIGLRSVRTNIQYLIWTSEAAELKARIDQFLDVASQYELSVILCLFDDCAFGKPPRTDPYLGAQQGPIPGMCGSSFTPSPGHSRVLDYSTWPSLHEYVDDLIQAFRSDQRILLWDLYNEPGNAGIGERSLPLLEETFRWARDCHPCQPLTSGVWNHSQLPQINAFCLSHSDIISFHHYGTLHDMEKLIRKYKTFGRPVMCTEWMARLLGSNFETDLPLLKAEGIGCYSWGVVNGRSQTQFHWDSPMGAPEPAIWFVDLFRRDRTPYDPAEIAAIHRLTAS